MGILKSGVNANSESKLLHFTQGIEVDSVIAFQEIKVQIAWARALPGAGVLTPGESEQVIATLKAAARLIQNEKFEWRVEDEDVHMNLERYVTENLGILGKKMHLGRSRNDLIATTLCLFVNESLRDRAQGLRDLILSLCDQAQTQMPLLVPGMTHLQHGQPIRFGHILVGHGWAFLRDLERLEIAALRAMEVMPLGSAALSGTTLEIDLDLIARELGFSEPPRNSYDAVGSRDSVIEALDAIASVAVHLSRLCEDLIFWSSQAVGLISLPKNWSTGSSIMPNKRNPDVPELIRGRSAQMMGAANEAHLLLKSVGTSYGSDLHEIKKILIRSLGDLHDCLNILPPFIREMTTVPKSAERLLKLGQILATEVADHLASRGVPFREAYAQVALLVTEAEGRGIQIEDLPPDVWKRLVPMVDGLFIEQLTPLVSVERRSQSGGTSLAQATHGLNRLREKTFEQRRGFSVSQD